MARATGTLQPVEPIPFKKSTGSEEKRRLERGEKVSVGEDASAS